ncbi:MAG: NAD+ synthase [Campylobacterota bacterium]|nr:NAD+ synthase [Campylobacterota bacterium]
MDYKNIKEQMINFLKCEVKNAGFEKVIVAISGGLDSSIVAVLCKEAFGDNMQGVLLPSQYSSNSSINDAITLCKKFKIAYDVLSIEPMVSGYLNKMEDDKIRIGNFSARMRMSVLYDQSAKHNALVVGTSNKSEILLGYGTLYGDTACAINPIGNIYKSDEFEFARFLGVPNEIINKKPSADLWEGQSDEEELGYSYKMLDLALKELYEKNKTKEEALTNGFDEDLLDMVIKRKESNEFKGRVPTIAKIDF